MTTGKGRKREAKTPASVAHRPKLLQWLKDQENAAAYVEAVLADGDSKGLMQALRNVAEAQGGITAVAARAGLSRCWQSKPI